MGLTRCQLIIIDRIEEICNNSRTIIDPFLVLNNYSFFEQYLRNYFIHIIISLYGRGCIAGFIIIDILNNSKTDLVDFPSQKKCSSLPHIWNIKIQWENNSEVSHSNILFIDPNTRIIEHFEVYIFLINHFF